MKPKSDKANEFPQKKGANFSKTSSKKGERDIDDDVVVIVEIEDDWEKADDDEDYDPDFEDFDIPRSKIKKPSAKKGKGDEDLDHFEYLKGLDLFNDGTDTNDDEDDF